MANEQLNLDPAEVLAVMHNNLNAQFFAGPRDEAKQLFNAIADSKMVPFMRIANKELGEVICHLSLDHSKFNGKLNFGTFRKSLATLLKRIAEKIEEDQPLNLLTSAEGDTLFNIPGVLENENQDINVLVSGLRQYAAGQLTIRLMFLDPDDYQKGANES